jgi:hypothetical protein
MAQLVPIPFWRQSAEGAAKEVSAEKLVNLYLEPKKNASPDDYPFHLMPTPGLRRLVTLGVGPIRGMHPMAGNLYVVSGNELYCVQSDYMSALVGAIAGAGAVAMAENGTHVLITTTGAESYAANATEIVAIPEPSLRGAAYQDGYGVAIKDEQFFISGIDDMETWNALDFSSADALADTLVGLASVHRVLWLFGQRTVEQWYNSGDAAFPFTRAQGGFMEVGCLAGNSVAIADNTVFWLGHDFSVYKAVGAQPVPVSTSEIAKMIEDSASPQSARAFVYKQSEHLHYVLLFSDLTLCFDVSTGLWHHRKSQGIERWRANCYAWQWNKHLVGDYDNGKLYELDADTFDEDGVALVREAHSAPVGNRAGRHSINKLFVDMAPGVGLADGTDPHVGMSQSRNGGRTFGAELTRSIGKVGEYDARAVFARLGQARNRVIKLRFSDPVKAIVLGVYAEIERLAA